MKKTLILIFSLISLSSAWAQSTFEGTIAYSFKLTGDMAEQVASFMPTGYTIKTKGNNSLVAMEGGMMAAMGTILHDGAADVTYMLDKTNKKALKMKADKNEVEPEVKVTKEAEVVEIAGYRCQKYKVIMTTDEGSVTQYIWAASDLKVTPSKSGSGNMSGISFIKGIDGAPLKIVSTQEQLGTMIITATKVTPENLDASLFRVPEGYKVEDFDPAKMMGGMGQ